MRDYSDGSLLAALYDAARNSKQFAEQAHMVIVAGSGGFAMPRFLGGKITLEINGREYASGEDRDDFKGILANVGGMRSAVARSEPSDIEDDFDDVELGPACALGDDDELCSSCQ